VLNEPIKGNAYMWSAPDQPFVLPVRIHNFEKWADDLAAQRSTKENQIETAAEVIRREAPHKRDRVDAAIREAVEVTANVALYTVEEVDGQATTDLVAIKMWNLLFHLGEVLGTDETLKSELCRTMGDGRIFCEETVCSDSLRRLGIFSGQANDEGENKYFLIEGKNLARAKKQTKLKLRRIR
jgi:hypothetical protein